MNVSFLKKIVPKFLLSVLRNLRNALYVFVDSFRPPLVWVKYCGFYLYHFKGPGLNYRLRWGNLDRVYERDLVESMVSELTGQPEPIFVDIGANIGLISLYIAAHVPAVKIFAFEPGPSQRSLLNINVQANKLEKTIEIISLAASNKNGQAEFFTYGEGEASCDGLVDTKRADKPLTKIQIQTVTLDNWWESVGRPAVQAMKVDTEGAELLVFEGAEKFLAGCKPAIFFELNALNLRVYPYKATDVVSWFAARSYQVFTLDGQLCTLENIDEIMHHHDTFVARPK